MISQHENENESPSKKELNNSIRKKLFDQNSEDLSSSTTSTTTAANHINNNGVPLTNKPINQFKGPFQNGFSNINSNNNSNPIKRLPKPEILSSASDTASLKCGEADAANSNKVDRVKTLASSSDDDCWRDSFDFEVFLKKKDF